MLVEFPAMGNAMAEAVCSHNATSRFPRGTFPRTLVAMLSQFSPFSGCRTVSTRGLFPSLSSNDLIMKYLWI